MCGERFTYQSKYDNKIETKTKKILLNVIEVSLHAIKIKKMEKVSLKHFFYYFYFNEYVMSLSEENHCLE